MAKFGIDRGTLQKAWVEDGIEAKQAELLGIVPYVAPMQSSGICVAMGSRGAAMAEGKEREKQVEQFIASRSELQGSLASLPARSSRLMQDAADADDPEVRASLELAALAVRREQSKIIADIQRLNSMIAEATGLDVIQSLSLAAAKAQASKQQAARQPEREVYGVVVDM